jgi:polyisoprenoid-binding protein YceI
VTRDTPTDAGRARAFLLVAVLLVVALGVGAWWFVRRDDADAVATLGECAAPPGEPTETPVGSWEVLPGDVETSFVGYRVDERFGGATVEKAATGRTGDVEGSLEVTEDAVTAAEVTAHLGGLQSNRTARDTALHTQGLETDEFPDATFTLTEPIPLRPLPEQGEALHAVATGTLELHGQEQAVEIPIDACWTGPTIRLSGSAPILLSDYGIEQIHTPIVDIADHGQLELTLVFTPR